MTKKNGDAIGAIRCHQWETEFFKRKLGFLELSDPEFLRNCSSQKIAASLGGLVERAEKKYFELIEFHLDAALFVMIHSLEDLGFRLVDSRFFMFYTHKKVRSRRSPTIVR